MGENEHNYDDRHDKATTSLLWLSTQTIEFIGGVARTLEAAWPSIFRWMVYLYDTNFQSSLTNFSDEHIQFCISISISGALDALSKQPYLSHLVASTPGSIELVTRLWFDTAFDKFNIALGTHSFYGTMAGLGGLLDAGQLWPHALSKRVLNTPGSSASGVAEVLLSRISNIALLDEIDRHYLTVLLNSLCQFSLIPSIAAAFLEAKSMSTITTLTCGLSWNSFMDPDLAHPALLCLNYISKNLETGDGVTPLCQSIKAGLLTALCMSSSELDKPLPDNVDPQAITNIISNIIPRYLTYRTIIQTIDDVIRESRPPIPQFRISDSSLKASWQQFLELFMERRLMMAHASLVKTGCDNAVSGFTMPCILFGLTGVVSNNAAM